MDKSESLFNKLRGGVLVAVACLGGFAGISDVNAQVRPAYTKNVDEPGRTPWETRSQVLPNAGGCFGTSHCANYAETTNSATWDLPVVPAGKRWVVVMANGGLVGAQGRTNNIELRSNRGGLVFDGLKWIYGGPFSDGIGFSSGIFSANLYTTFGPGETPIVRVSATPNLNGYVVIVFQGYLIDATNN